jgi:hypothetical protein
VSRHTRWLWSQLDDWIVRGLVSTAQADQIRALYPAPKAALAWATVIFAGMGAGIIGLGHRIAFGMP